jgi:hypothetical protein
VTDADVSVWALAFRRPELGVIAAVVIVGAAVAGLIRHRRRQRRMRPWRAEAPIANAHLAGRSRVFNTLLRRYRWLVGLESAALSVTGLAAVVLLMQPVAEVERERSTLSRDVMLCLDVSGSMKELDESVLRQFIDIAAGLPGDRIGLTIWNGSAITVFPLTDDADYVRTMLEFAVDQLNRGARSFVLGTEEGGSSLIGDGLASCVLRFDRLEEDRARSILFATDNALAGDPIVSLAEAAAMARQRGIRVYGVATAGQITEDDAERLRRAVVSTGGAYLTTEDEKVVDSVVDAISASESALLEQPPEVVLDDRPTSWAAVTMVGTGVLSILCWRLRR